MTVITVGITTTGATSANQSDSATQQADPVQTETGTTIETNNSAVASNSNTDTVEISTRGQKIQKLNEEFFSAGPRDFKISAEFINRLEEYGFLSAGEAEKLGGSAGVTSKGSEGAKTIGELSHFIDDFTERIEQIEPESSLINVMQQAQIVIDDFNDPTANSLSINILKITEQLKSYNDAGTGLLSNTDQQSFDKLILALGIANALTPGTNTTAEIDRYLAINEL